MKRIVLAGGSGFLGQALATHLEEKGYEVKVLTRSPQGPRDVLWDARTIGEWTRVLDGAEAVVNFTGRSVNCRYTPENRREILASRIDSVQVLGEALARCASPPRAWIQAGSLAVFGDGGDAIREEHSPLGEGFSVEVCKAWERAFEAASGPSRKVYLRIGFVLGRDGGALEPLAKLTRWFLGGTVGNGRQFISWLHIDDLNRLIEWAIVNDQARGTYNATGPTPVPNAVFMRTLRRVLGRPWSPPTPAFAVHLGARFVLRTEAELALTGRRCVSRRLEQEGFRFEHQEIERALGSLLLEPARTNSTD